uniref:Ig-like domain-containing protein n=1 Tax=Salmo trutta TaxID=8032 RepID=A0A674CYJ0_SALTR
MYILSCIYKPYNSAHDLICNQCISLSVLASNKTKALATKTEISEQVMKKEIVYGEVESDTEIKASHTQMVMPEGQSLTLRANIPGASDIRWILKGMELANSEDYRYGVSGNNHTMFIKKVSQYKQGVITCEAKTEHSPCSVLASHVIKCQFDTTVTEAQSDAPSFLVQPHSQSIAREPAPEIECLKDNIMVSMTSNRKLSCSKNVYTLEIIEATVADSGKYTIKAKNKYGQCSGTSSINITTLVQEPAKMVIKEQSAAAASLHSDSFSATSVHMAEASMTQEGYFQSQFESISAASVSAITSESMVSMSSSSITEMLSEMMSKDDMLINSFLFLLLLVAPKIESLPEDISIEPRKTLSVSCAFSGHPTPEIEWLGSAMATVNIHIRSM